MRLLFLGNAASNSAACCVLRAACCVLRAGHVHCKVYNDFFQYKSGVYNGCSPPANQSRKIAGYHAIKIVGWGSTDIDPVLDYWYECTRAFCAAVCNPFMGGRRGGRRGCLTAWVFYITRARATCVGMWRMCVRVRVDECVRAWVFSCASLWGECLVFKRRHHMLAPPQRYDSCHLSQPTLRQHFQRFQPFLFRISLPLAFPLHCIAHARPHAGRCKTRGGMGGGWMATSTW